jgi:hypothetical protein
MRNIQDDEVKRQLVLQRIRNLEASWNRMVLRNKRRKGLL